MKSPLQRNATGAAVMDKAWTMPKHKMLTTSAFAHNAFKKTAYGLTKNVTFCRIASYAATC
jgi:hypothetical protein